MYDNLYSISGTLDRNRTAKKPAAPQAKMSKNQTTIDSIDRKILSALSNNGQLTMNELAGSVGLSASPCWTRVRRLESMGVIEKYVAVLDNEVVGLANVVFIEIALDKHEQDSVEKFGDKLSRMPEVLEVHLVAGEYDFLVKVVASDPGEYELFLRQKLYALAGIRHSRSIFKLRTMKRSISIDPLLLI